MSTVRERLAEFDALLLASGIWFLAKFLRYAFPALFPTFRVTYDVSNAILGTAFTAMMLTYAAMQFPAGAIADRVGAPRVIAIGSLIAATGAVVLAFDVPRSVLLLGMILIGMGTGAHKTVSVRLLSGVYPDRTGRVLGVFDTFGTTGGIVAPVAVLLLSRTVGWHATFLAGGVLGFALAVGTALRVAGRDGTGGPREFDVDRYAALFADPGIAAFVGVTVLFSFAYNGTIAFLPLYLTDAAGVSGTAANLLYGLVFAVSVVQPVSGGLSDRYGRLRVAGAAIAIATAGIALLLLGGGAVRLAIAVVAFGIGGHSFRPVRGAYLMRALPDSSAGGGLGLIRTILTGAGAVAPAIVGTVSTVAGYRVAFGLLGASLALALGGVVAVARLGRSSA